jgi:L-alanine-DL-glutamate epimerase-like enolase superfamily enzyme
MPKIARVETFPVLYPTVGRFKFFEGSAGRKAGRPSVVVKVTADDGAVGWGQCVPSPRWSYETLETVLTTIERYLAPEIVGTEVDNFNEIHARMNRAIAPSFSIGQPIAKAGIDLALWDLVGKMEGKSAAERLARGRNADQQRDQVELSWTINPVSLDEVERSVHEARERGYRHFNVKVAPDAGFDLELCRRIRQLAPQAFLWADANGGYDLDTALAVAPRFADLGVAVFEQPLSANRLSGYRRLKEQGALPIIMDEGIVSVTDLEEFTTLDLLDGVAMKVARSGGLTEAQRILELVEKHGLMFLASGLTDPDLSLAASLALFGAYGLRYPAALNGPQYLAASILQEPLAVVEGAIAVPCGPGLGVNVDEEKLASLRIKVDI